MKKDREEPRILTELLLILFFLSAIYFFDVRIIGAIKTNPFIESEEKR